MGQAQQIAVVAAETTAHHVRHHADVEGRLLDDMQWQLHLDAGAAALAGGAVLGAAVIDPLEPGRHLVSIGIGMAGAALLGTARPPL